MRAGFIKRVMAFIIDLTFLLTIVTMAVSAIPKSREHEEASKELNKIQDLYLHNEIEFDEYLELIAPNLYKIDYEDIQTNISTLFISIIYFALIPFLLNGKTLGKYIMRIKMIKNNGAKLTFGALLVRSLFINFILFDIILLILVLSVSQEVYMISLIVISFLTLLYLLICSFMIIYGEDKEAIHDKIAKSKIIKDW